MAKGCNTWANLTTLIKRHWKCLNPRRKERPTNKLKNFYQLRINHSTNALLIAVEKYYKLLYQLSRDKYTKAKDNTTRYLYEAFGKNVRTVIRQRINKSDKDIKIMPYEEFRKWLIAFATDKYEVNGSFTKPTSLLTAA